MIIKGKVHKFGKDINTDDIIAAKYLVSTDEKELGRHCMENIAGDFAGIVNKGDIIVAGKNFGCGSSREHAPRALKGCGIAAVIARSFAGIFFRNSINVGLPFLQLEEADKIKEGDLLEIDLTGGIIKNLSAGQTYRIESFPQFLQEIIKQGGLMNYIKKRCQ
ncbi:MAG TPA: 3-isopropylmalate dehydratase small subunit [Candidatus Omnitrophota bacterium]|nr:3-isopropylmalate dehydratase small subunit [Candidatus Omnitrophota bacterium]